LGGVQSAFFAGYALTQVAGGRPRRRRGGGPSRRGGGRAEADGRRRAAHWRQQQAGAGRRALPVRAAAVAVPDGDRHAPLPAGGVGGTGLGVGRPVLPGPHGGAAPAGGHGGGQRHHVGAGRRRRREQRRGGRRGGSSDCSRDCSHGGGRADVKATASSIVIAGCYLGSAWAYLSAWGLYSPGFQSCLLQAGFDGPVWPLVFYANGVLSLVCLLFFRDEFDLSMGLFTKPDVDLDVETRSGLAAGAKDLISDTVDVARETVLSRSGRAILAAQVGQGALLYSIASWGPLYLERLGPTQGEVADDAAAGVSDLPPGVSALAVTARTVVVDSLWSAVWDGARSRHADPTGRGHGGDGRTRAAAAPPRSPVRIGADPECPVPVSYAVWGTLSATGVLDKN
ncbi:hypothetical protein THAOC_33624, partial [Thalassiosira oceanica]